MYPQQSMYVVIVFVLPVHAVLDFFLNFMCWASVLPPDIVTSPVMEFIIPFISLWMSDAPEYLPFYSCAASLH